ncbi:MAG: amidohydrolase family protein [Anaerolineae bacterium]|nr:amidohydrolase family protein [Anaerolineae bacterium]MDQ7034943.1 amidohydrolase family protein [Anaerolineae bacterium]
MLKIDTHQHFWNLDKVAYPWLVPEFGPIYRTFEPPELEPQLKAVGVDKTVIVQAMDSYADTNSMLDIAANYDWVAGVVGWVPLLDPEETAKKLDEYGKNPYFKGIRHLIHEEKHPDWVIQKQVIESLQILAERGLTFDVVAVFPNHLKHIPTLVEKVPNLKIVINHLAKPPLDEDARKIWREQMAAAAQSPNVYAKVSGLNTVTPDFENWTYEDIKPLIDFALEKFGAERLMFGSDWPVAILAGDYAKVWNETKKAIADLSQAEQDAILGGTGNAFYSLNL